jgi:hypothetical protein
MDRTADPLGLPGGGYTSRLRVVVVVGRFNGVDDVVSELVEALLLIQLRASRPDGTPVGERERTCHLVPFSPSEVLPENLTSSCGLLITPGMAESLDRLLGMPCEACLAGSPMSAFAALRQLWNADEPVGQLADRGVS